MRNLDTLFLWVLIMCAIVVWFNFFCLLYVEVLK